MPQDQIPPAPAGSPVGSLRGWRLGVLILTLGCLGVVLARMVFLFNWDKLKFSASQPGTDRAPALGISGGGGDGVDGWRDLDRGHLWVRLSGAVAACARGAGPCR